MEMTRAEAVEYLQNIKGTRPVGMSVVTSDKDISGVPFIKYSEVAGLVGFTYENSVRNATGDTSFVAQSLSWGRHVGGAIIEHKGTYYVQVKIQSTKKPVYFMHGRVSGKPVMRPRKQSSPVLVRTYKLDSVARIRIDGMKINLV